MKFGTTDFRSHGLGDTRRFRVDQQVDGVVEALNLMARPAAATLLSRSVLPARTEREAKG